MKKKYLALVLAACMTASLAACGSTAADTSAPAATTEEAADTAAAESTEAADTAEQPVSMDPAAKLLRHGRIMMQESLRSDRRQIL